MAGSDRRTVLLTLGALGFGAWWGWPRVAPFFVGDFDFAPIPGLPGFRRLASGETSAGLGNPFLGIGAPGEAADPPPTDVRNDLCTALFGVPPPADVVPIAAFSDYNCPFCRRLTDILTDLEADAAGQVRLSWHEWPLLGPTSEPAARAALAAGKQGAYLAFHKRLMRTPLVMTPDYLAALAENLNLDPARLITAMNDADITAHIARSGALASVFGMPGTPSMVVGRTLVVGAITAPALRALVAQERAEGPVPACGMG